jgi:hypothetical protein
MNQNTSPVGPALLNRFKLMVSLGMLICLSDLACMLLLGDRFPTHFAGLVLLPALLTLFVAFHCLSKGAPPKRRYLSRARGV